MSTLSPHRLDRLWIYFAPLFVVLLGLDQVTKEWAVSNLKLYENADFGLVLSQNTGVVFGFDLPLWTIYVLTGGILALGAYVVWKEKLWRDHWHLTGLALILAGAMGNLIDRVRLDYVVDFIKVYWWPTFNFADVWIVAGVVLLTWSTLFRGKVVEKL